MEIYHDLTIDLLNPRQNVIHVVQEDSQRKLRLTLLAGNAPFDVSADLEEGENLLTFVEFVKADKTGGIYDTTALGEPAVVLEGNTTNVWLVALDGRCFTAPGWAKINVRFETESGKRLLTFGVLADVEANAAAMVESEDYYNIQSLSGLRNSVAAVERKLHSLFAVDVAYQNSDTQTQPGNVGEALDEIFSRLSAGGL